MLTNELDEDFPLNGGSEKLDRLFEENSLPDISFKFTGSKTPGQRPKPPPNDKLPMKIVCAKIVVAFFMKVDGYKPEGKVGIAIIGNDDQFYYQLYMYKSDEKKVANVEINYRFGFFVQKNDYASFRDAHNILWSVHFDKTADLISFSRDIALARWRSDQGVHQKVVQEAFKGNPEMVVKKTDFIRVSYTVYSLSPDYILHKEESLRRTESGLANSSSWETVLAGACVGSLRFVILPPQLSSFSNHQFPEGYILVLEMKLEEASVPPEPSAEPPTAQLALSQSASSQSCVDRKEESESLPERMSRIGYALPSLQSSNDSSGNVSDPSLVMSDRSERAKPAPSNKPGVNPSKVSFQSASSTPRTRDDISFLAEPCDVSTTSQFNVLFSEVRTNNSEIRMNLNRVTDKMDSLASKMDFIPQMNHEVIPALKKIQNMDGMLNELMNKSNTLLMQMEKLSPVNLQLESSVEIMHLKKRNAELESFLEVSQSTSQILKERVTELMGKSLAAGCGDSRNTERQRLEESVASLQESKNSLLESVQHLKRTNLQLNTQLSHLLDETSDKDMRIAELQKEVSGLNGKLRSSSSMTGKDKDLENIVKGLMNKIYRTLKEDLKNLTTDRDLLDKTLFISLRDLTRKYLNSGGGLGQSVPSTIDDEGYQQREGVLPESQIFGNLPFSPSFSPLPVPRPRRPAPRSKPLPADKSDGISNSLQAVEVSNEISLTDKGSSQNRDMPEDKVLEKVNTSFDEKKQSNLSVHKKQSLESIKENINDDVLVYKEHLSNNSSLVKNEKYSTPNSTKLLDNDKTPSLNDSTSVSNLEESPINNNTSKKEHVDNESSLGEKTTSRSAPRRPAPRSKPLPAAKPDKPDGISNSLQAVEVSNEISLTDKGSSQNRDMPEDKVLEKVNTSFDEKKQSNLSVHKKQSLESIKENINDDVLVDKEHLSNNSSLVKNEKYSTPNSTKLLDNDKTPSLNDTTSVSNLEKSPTNNNISKKEHVDNESSSGEKPTSKLQDNFSTNDDSKNFFENESSEGFFKNVDSAKNEKYSAPNSPTLLDNDKTPSLSDCTLVSYPDEFSINNNTSNGNLFFPTKKEQVDNESLGKKSASGLHESFLTNDNSDSFFSNESSESFFKNVDSESPCGREESSSVKKSTDSSSVYKPYSSSYYTPLFSTTPPPIDDGSDT